LTKNFTILDQQDSIDILGMIRNEIISKNSRFPQKDTLQKIYSYTLNTGTSIEDYLLKEYPHFYHLTNEIEKLFIAYQNYKIENNVLDYDDLLKYTVLLLNSNDKIADNFLKSLSFIMIDEYQDTNHLQALITKALAKFNNNVMAVGDDSQSIYSFRGANFKNIMEFPQLFPKVQIIKLQENYRSPQEILDFSNEIIRNLKYNIQKFYIQIKKEKRNLR